MRQWRDAAKVCGVYIGVIVGAGFASGQEVMRFFVCYGHDWVWGMGLAGLLFALSGWAALRLIRKERLRTYGDFCSRILGRRLGRAMEWVCGLFLFALFCTMTAGAGAAVQELLGWPRWIGAGILLAVCLAVFARGVKAMVAINAVLTPLLLAGGAALSAMAWRAGLLRNAGWAWLPGGLTRTAPAWIFSAIIYVSYNMVTTISVLLPLRGYLQDSRTPRRAGLVGGAAMTGLGMGLGATLYHARKRVWGKQLPLLAALGSLTPGLTAAYLAFFGAAVLTTAVGDGFAALEFFRNRFPGGQRIWPLVLIAGAAAASRLDFSRWVSLVYPFFGYLGLLELAALLLSFRKS